MLLHNVCSIMQLYFSLLSPIFTAEGLFSQDVLGGCMVGAWWVHGGCMVGAW